MKSVYITKKIKSENGASLSFALMLLLVATVVGAILLTSATAAAGRVSQLAKADSRYYNVNSAADLIAAELEGTKLEIARTMVQTQTKVTVISENKNNYVTRGTPEIDLSEPRYTVSFVDPDDGSISRGRIMVRDWAMDKILGVNYTTPSSAWSRSPLSPPDDSATGNGSVTRKYQIEHSTGGTVNAAGLTANMEVVIGKDGNLTITISNVDDTNKDYYRVQLIYAAEVQQTTSVTESNPVKTVTPKTAGLPADIILQTEEKITFDTTTLKTTSICWTLIDRKELSN